MTAHHHMRASEYINAKDIQSSAFNVRNRFLSTMGLVRLFILAVIIIIGSTYLIINEMEIVALLCVSIGGSCAFLGHYVERQRNIINATEFMNALFTSLLCRDHAFCMILRLDGSIIYLDRNFQTTFNDFIKPPPLHLESWLEKYEVPADQGHKLLDMVKNSKEGNLAISAKPSGQAAKQFALSVETINRPAGFVAIRGK